MPKLETSTFPYQIVLEKNLSTTIGGDPYTQAVEKILDHILPPGCFSSFTEDVDEQRDQLLIFHELLPLVTWSRFQVPPFNLAFYLICKLRHNAFKFFYEMISTWLIPGKPPDVLLFFAVDFSFPELNDQTYTASEVVMRIETEEEFKKLQRNLPIIETELRLGMNSLYQASRILEVKGLSGDVKTAMIQEHIVSLLNRRPQDFDYDIISELQHFLVMCREDFKTIREYRHMGRIISVLYLFRKALRVKLKEAPNKRHLSLKLIKARLHPSDQTKVVLGVLVGLNFFKENEFFDERHVVKAISDYIPNIRAVESSLFSHRDKRDPICTIYLEVEHDDGADFTLEKIKELTEKLPSNLKNRIEHLVNPVFMPPNEEEILKNIVLLSEEVKLKKDIPQVIIAFDKQSDSNISFTIILVRVLVGKEKSLEDIFYNANSEVTFITDQVKVVGKIRRKYLKEANVFRLEIDKTPYLREDHSVDLFKARVAIVGEIENVIGKFRDYNGGMICKQNELFILLKESVGEISKSEMFLLENFFYSLTPSIMRVVSDPIVLKKLFHMLLQIAGKEFQTHKHYILNTEKDERNVYAMLSLENFQCAKKIQDEVQLMGLPSMDLVATYLIVHNIPCLGFVYSSKNDSERQSFIENLELIIKNTDSSF